MSFINDCRKRLNFSLTIGTLLVVLLLTACEKNILDKQPLDRLSEEAVWNDANLIETFVNRTYRVMPHGFEIINQRLMSTMSDEANYRNNANYNRITSGNVTPSSLGPLDYWQGTANAPGYYNTISMTNIFFDHIESAQIDSARKARMIGEMKVLRAFSYLQMISIFGGVPLITKAFKLTDNFSIPRNTYDEVMSFVVKEAGEAAALLPLSYDATNRGRITRGAALAVKSRALLYAASPLNNPANDRAKWQAAADAAKAVIDLNLYSLYPDYKNLFLDIALYNSEIIWSRPFNITQGQETYLERGLYPNGPGYNGFGQIHPLHNLVEAYETKNGKLQKDDPTYNSQKPYENLDPRFYVSILYDGAPFKSRNVETFLPGGLDTNEGPSSPHNATQTSYYQRKMADERITNPSGTVAGNSPWIRFRLAEIYLNYAEAMYNLGDDAVARQYINMVRARPSVNMPPVTEGGPALLTRLQNERRIELVFEEHRYFDVRRWKIAPITDNEDGKKMTIIKDAAGNKTYKVEVFQDRNFFERNYLAPIPQSEIEKNPKLVQNPGY